MRMLFIATLVLAGYGSPAEPMTDAGTGADGAAPSGDSDGDGISDVDEGRAEDRDSDMDGTPD